MALKPKILVLDDEPEIVGLLNLFLEDDFEVDIFTDPRVACDQLQKTKYDLVVSDIKMPYMDGLEVVVNVRAKSPGTVIVLITGHAQTEQDRIHARNLGASGILFKPFGDPSKVVAYLQDAIANGAPQIGPFSRAGETKLTNPSVSVNSSSKRRLLVLDDEPDLVEVVVSFLSEDFEVESFIDPVAAISSANSKSYDCIITDLNMPIIGGAEVILKFKTASPNTPVIIMTGHSPDDLEIKEAFEAGAVDILSKPFPNPDEIMKIIGKYIK